MLNAQLITAAQDTGQLVEAAFTGLILGAILGTLFDILAIDAGIITLFDRAHYKGHGAIRSAGSYRPFFFGGFGLLVNLLACLGYQGLAAGASAWVLTQWVVGGSALLCLPFALFLALIHGQRKKSRLRRNGNREIT